MIHTFAYSLVFGFPVIMYGGIATYLLLLATAAISVLNVKYGIHVIPFKWHPILAVLTIIAATIHGIFGMSVYLNF